MSADTPLWAEDAAGVADRHDARRGDRRSAPAAAAEAITAPAADARGPAEYRTKMAGVMTARALDRAASRAAPEPERRRPWRTPRHVDGQRQARSRRWSSRARCSIHFLREQLDAHRPAYRLRDHPLRRLHRRSRRHVGEVLHGVRGAGRRRRDPHHRGHGRRRRHAARAAGGLPRDARAAMRLLHAGHDHARLPAAAGEPEPDRGGDPLRHLRQPLPLHRLSEHRQGHSVRRRQARRPRPSRRPRNERHTSPATQRERAEKLAGHRLQAQAHRGRPLHPGQGQLCRRPQAAGHAVRRLRPLPLRPCPDQVDRHLARRRPCRACWRC